MDGMDIFKMDIFKFQIRTLYSIIINNKAKPGGKR